MCAFFKRTPTHPFGAKMRLFFICLALVLVTAATYAFGIGDIANFLFPQQSNGSGVTITLDQASIEQLKEALNKEEGLTIQPTPEDKERWQELIGRMNAAAKQREGEAQSLARVFENVRANSGKVAQYIQPQHIGTLAEEEMKKAKEGMGKALSPKKVENARVVIICQRNIENGVIKTSCYYSETDYIHAENTSGGSTEALTENQSVILHMKDNAISLIYNEDANGARVGGNVRNVLFDFNPAFYAELENTPKDWFGWAADDYERMRVRSHEIKNIADFVFRWGFGKVDEIGGLLTWANAWWDEKRGATGLKKSRHAFVQRKIAQFFDHPQAYEKMVIEIVGAKCVRISSSSTQYDCTIGLSSTLSVQLIPY